MLIKRVSGLSLSWDETHRFHFYESLEIPDRKKTLSGSTVKMIAYFAILILSMDIHLFAYANENKEVQSPEEELYGVKYAQDCEGEMY